MKIKGQFRMPRLSGMNTIKMNLFLSMRRCKYPIDLLCEKMGLTKLNNSLKLNYGKDGEYLIPNRITGSAIANLLPDLNKYSTNDFTRLFEAEIEEAMRSQGDMELFKLYSQRPDGCPQLYFDFRIFTPDDGDYSYLYWSGGDKSQLTEDTISYLDSIIFMLANVGLIDGQMARYDYGQVTIVKLENDEVSQQEVQREGEAEEEGDYITFISGLEPQPRTFVAYIHSNAVRNAEVFNGTEEELNDEDGEAIYDDSFWDLKEDLRAYLGIVKAYDHDEARAIAAQEHNVNPDMICVDEVI